MKLSSRSQVETSESALSIAIREARASGQPHLDLTLSNPTLAGLSYAMYAPVFQDAFSAEDTAHYDADALGLLAAREAVVQHWPQSASDAAPQPDQVLMLPSSSEAYHYLFSLLCDPGDEVLAPEPSYPLFAHLARYAGVGLKPYRLAYDGAWHIDFESLQSAVTPQSRAVLLVSPNNPTGSCASAGELERLSTLGLPLISDEVFSRYPLRPDSAGLGSALGRTDALTFCIDGLSKSAGLPQLKLSWLAASGPAEAVNEALRRLSWISDTYLTVASPVQRMLPRLLEAAPSFRKPLIARLQANLAQLQAALEGSAASVLQSEGGWYAVVRLPAVASEEQWVLGLLKRKVVTHPGHFYDFEGGAPHLVLSLLPEPETFAAGLKSLRSELEHRVLIA